MRKFGILGATFCLLLASNANAATNLITNGGFETGDFTGWTPDAVSYPLSVVTRVVESGLYAAQIAGFPSGPDTLSQIVTDTAGGTYELSFWRDQYQPNNIDTISLDVTWDGKTIFSEFDPGYQPYQNFALSVVGTGSDSLVFISANANGYTYLDNVSLTPLTVAIPEPSVWIMMFIGFAGLGAVRAIRRKNAWGMSTRCFSGA